MSKLYNTLHAMYRSFTLLESIIVVYTPETVAAVGLVVEPVVPFVASVPVAAA
jgi:hypothetical protein